MCLFLVTRKLCRSVSFEVARGDEYKIKERVNRRELSSKEIRFLYIVVQTREIRVSNSCSRATVVESRANTLKLVHRANRSFTFPFPHVKSRAG